MTLAAKDKAYRAADQFDRWESTNHATRKQAVEDQVCKELIASAQMEAETFSPVVRKALPRRQRRCWQ